MRQLLVRQKQQLTRMGTDVTDLTDGPWLESRTISGVAAKPLWKTGLARKNYLFFFESFCK